MRKTTDLFEHVNLICDQLHVCLYVFFYLIIIITTLFDHARIDFILTHCNITSSVACVYTCFVSLLYEHG